MTIYNYTRNLVAGSGLYDIDALVAVDIKAAFPAYAFNVYCDGTSADIDFTSTTLSGPEETILGGVVDAYRAKTTAVSGARFVPRYVEEEYIATGALVRLTRYATKTGGVLSQKFDEWTYTYNAQKTIALTETYTRYDDRGFAIDSNTFEYETEKTGSKVYIRKLGI